MITHRDQAPPTRRLRVVPGENGFDVDHPVAWKGSLPSMTAVERPATVLRPVVIAVVTYRRIDDLAAMVPVVLQERASVANPVTMLIVDNDPARSAEQVVAGFSTDGVTYASEPTPGIAAARNKALAEADPAALLIFIDDDEHPVAGWLAALVATQAETGAAGVAGPVLSEFESEPDEWIRAGRFFVRRRWSTGTSMTLAATNNLLLDMEQVNAVGLRFDERFGLSGGSDTMFTRTLARSGRTIIWCDEAVVIDRVPNSRLTHQWVLKRAFRTGNSDSHTALALCANGRERLMLKAKSAARGSARIVAGAGMSGFGVVTGSVRRRARGRRAIHRGAGIVAGAFGWVYSEYARKGNSAAAVGSSAVGSSAVGSSAPSSEDGNHAPGLTSPAGTTHINRPAG